MPKIKRPPEKAASASAACGVAHPQGQGMNDPHLTGLKVEVKARERSREYFLYLLKDDPFNWSLRLDVQALEAEIQELKKAVCATEMKQCG
jgi:hypothetical protein